MQALLIAHANDLMHDEDVDGDFGSHTQDVLRTWQGRTKVLVADGVCGPATWAWLCGVWRRCGQYPGLPAAGSRSETSGDRGPFLDRLLSAQW